MEEEYNGSSGALGRRHCCSSKLGRSRLEPVEGPSRGLAAGIPSPGSRSFFVLLALINLSDESPVPSALPSASVTFSVGGIRASAPGVAGDATKALEPRCDRGLESSFGSVGVKFPDFMDRTPVKNGETRDRAGEEASGELVGGVPPEEASTLLKPSGAVAAEGGVSMASGEPRPSLDGIMQRIFGGLGEADGELLHLSGRRRHWALGEAST